MLFEVCSIKIYPHQILQKHFTNGEKYILSHPMFGPESFKKNNYSLKNFNIVFQNGNLTRDHYHTILNF
jgi:prephenate dehydrogenase